MTIVILVTHLLGTGHLGRALILARAYATAGHRAVVISGGTPVPNFDYSGIELRQLPPLRSDGTNFTRLLAEDGTEVTAPYLDTRRTRISDWLSDLAPDILITELYPFGRRILADEFLAALACARALPRPALVLSSIRDILAPPSKPAKAERADEIIAQHYDAVLVHSDPQATPLELSWPVSDQLARKLRYTGYVAAPAPIPHPQKLGAGEILVSAGGGNVGQPIFEAALSAARLVPNHPWRLLVGGQNAKDRIKALSAAGLPGHVTVEPARPEFRQMLNHAAASVSMCGYNTAMDLLQTGVPAVVIPFDDGNEVEQGLRAKALARLDALEILRSDDLDGPHLADAVQRALSSPRRRTDLFQFDGSAQAVSIANSMIEARA